MHLKSLAALVGLLALAGTTARAQHPDFTGTYKLDMAASRPNGTGGELPGIDRGLLRIERRGREYLFLLTMIVEGRAEVDSLSLTPDGTAQQRTGSLEVTSTVWAGDTLVATTRLRSGSEQSETIALFFLDDGGRTLTMRTRFAAPGQSRDGRGLVFRRSPGVGGRP